MAPRFKQNMYRTYKNIKTADALICFADKETDFTFPFRDKLAENILKKYNLYLNKAENGPYDIDICLRFFNLENKETAEVFFAKKYPGFLSWFLKTTTWKEYKRESQKIDQLIQIEMRTSHDYPCIDLFSSIHTEDELKILIENIAKEINIDMHYNANLPSMSDIIMSNKKFDLQKT